MCNFGSFRFDLNFSVKTDRIKKKKNFEIHEISLIDISLNGGKKSAILLE